MRPPQRRAGLTPIESLLQAPQAFEFVQAVSILLRWLEERGVAPEAAMRTHLRFENSLRLGFPASEVEALRLAPGSSLDENSVGELCAPCFHMTPAFMGLLGAHGALPAHYTERIAQWQAAQDDAAPRAFLDLLSGRMLALYYAAWCKYRIEHSVTADGDTYLPRLLALAGIGASATSATSEASDASGSGKPSSPRSSSNSSSSGSALAPGSNSRQAAEAGLPAALFGRYAGLLQQRPRSAAVLQRLLSGYFGLPLALEEMVGHWSRMAPHEQSALGGGACLGENAMLGARAWRPDLRARLRFGPLKRSQFERLLPSGDIAAALRRILAALAPPGIDFEVQLVLQAREVGPCQLAGGASTASTATTPSRLGRDSFLISAAVGEDRADMRYTIATMAPLASVS